MLLNNCATSINNNLEQSISNNYSSFDQALSVNKLFYAENKDKNELKVDRELILEALKYEFSDTKELNTLITLSQSDNLKLIVFGLLTCLATFYFKDLSLAKTHSPICASKPII